MVRRAGQSRRAACPRPLELPLSHPGQQPMVLSGTRQVLQHMTAKTVGTLLSRHGRGGGLMPKVGQITWSDLGLKQVPLEAQAYVSTHAPPQPYTRRYCLDASGLHLTGPLTQGTVDDSDCYRHSLDTLVWSAFGNNSTLTLYRTTQLTTWCFWLYWNLAGVSLSMVTPGGPLLPMMVDAPRLVSIFAHFRSFDRHVSHVRSPWIIFLVC